MVLHAHSTLQRYGGMGYLSEWAGDQFSDLASKNEFYSSFGESFSPRGDQILKDSLNSEMSASEVSELAIGQCQSKNVSICWIWLWSNPRRFICARSLSVRQF